MVNPVDDLQIALTAVMPEASVNVTGGLYLFSLPHWQVGYDVAFVEGYLRPTEAREQAYIDDMAQSKEYIYRTTAEGLQRERAVYLQRVAMFTRQIVRALGGRP